MASAMTSMAPAASSSQCALAAASQTPASQSAPTTAPQTPGAGWSEAPRKRECAVCGAALVRAAFSRRQWDKPSHDPPSCRPCLNARHAFDHKSSSIRNGNRLASGEVVRPNNWGYSLYLDEVFKMRCFPELVQIGAFNTAKDISESMAALHAARRHAGVAWDDRDVVCLCVGDGSAPRTGSLAAFVTKWRMISVDPALKEPWHGDEAGGVRRLRCFRGTIDAYMATREPDAAPARLVVFCVHSHARLVGASTVPRMRARFGDPPTSVIALPCCARVRPERDIGAKPDRVYHDDCVFSEKRRVEMWHYDGGA